MLFKPLIGDSLQTSHPSPLLSIPVEVGKEIWENVDDYDDLRALFDVQSVCRDIPEAAIPNTELSVILPSQTS